MTVIDRLLALTSTSLTASHTPATSGTPTRLAQAVRTGAGGAASGTSSGSSQDSQIERLKRLIEQLQAQLQQAQSRLRSAQAEARRHPDSRGREGAVLSAQAEVNGLFVSLQQAYGALLALLRKTGKGASGASISTQA